MTTDLARQTDEQPNTALANPEEATAALTHYLGTGDLSRLSGEQKAALYLDTCTSLGINPRTRPFDWIEFYDPETKSKKLTLYPNKACADQLAYQHRIRVRTVEEKIVGTLFKVVVEGTMLDGRTETNVSYLDLTDRDGNQLRGQRLGNAFMKGHTKAKRRLVFGMLGMMSPPDLDDLQRVRVVTVDGAGNVLANPTIEQRALAERPEMAQAIGEPTYESTAEQWPAGANIFDGATDQRPRIDELELPKREGPRPSFRASDEDVKRWLGAWFAAVKGTPLDTDEGRHLWVEEFTCTWPEAKQTTSLRTMFMRSTPEEAEDALARARAEADRERARASEQSKEPPADPDTRPMADLSDEEIEARFEQKTEQLIGRPRAEDQGPTRTELITGLRAMVAELQQRGGSVDVPEDLTALSDAEIDALTEQLAASLRVAF